MKTIPGNMRKSNIAGPSYFVLPAKYYGDEIKAGELEGHLARMGEKRNVRRILV
jgi:hypothetical protein